jgi:tRNA pseudouridine synthase 10
MHAVIINEHFFQLRLVTSGGTYVKEFVHSDFNRTKPSIAEILGSRADILQLDVLGLGWNLEEVEHLLTQEIE